MQSIIIRFEHVPYERILAVLQWTLLVVGFVVYIYAIALSVANVVLREEYVVVAESERARIAELEAVYHDTLLTLNKEYAHTLGLVQVSPLTYVPLDGGDRLTHAR